MEYNAACTVWCGMRNQNIKTCRMKFSGRTSTSTGMGGSFNPPMVDPVEEVTSSDQVGSWLYVGNENLSDPIWAILAAAGFTLMNRSTAHDT